MRSLASGFFVTLLLALPSAAQQPALSEQVDVNAVLIDTIVTDSKGNQILGLGKDDFIVTENGVKQTVDSVDYVTTRRLLDQSEQKAPFRVERVREERYIVLFFDKPIEGGMFEQLARARSEARKYIEQKIGGNDLVAVAGHDVRLKIFSDFTSDKKQLAKALREVGTFGNGITGPRETAGPSIFRTLDEHRMMYETGTTYQGLEVLADALRAIPARKNLVLFSPGIHEPGEVVRGGLIVSPSRYYDPMVQSLNAANVTVFAANLMTMPPSEPYYHQTLERITSDTNGQYFRHATSFAPTLREVEKASGGYYLLTYRSNKAKGTSGFQKVEVTVPSQPELRVKARTGYLYGN